MPLVVVMVLLFSALAGGSDNSTPNASDTGVIALQAPPNAAAQASACAKLVAVLPARLAALDQRIVKVVPEVPGVVAWGSPAVVLRCGAARPKDLQPGSEKLLQPGGDPVHGPWYDITSAGSNAVWTTVDRGPYVSITVPSKYTPDSVIVPLSTLIRQVLPAVCSTAATAPTEELCTRRP